MKLRFVVKTEGESRTVEIHGELSVVAVGELNKLCTPKTDLVIDLSHLKHVDEGAAARLRELSLGGVKLAGASPFISMLIDGDPA